MKKFLLFLLANLLGLLMFLAALWLGRDRLLRPRLPFLLLETLHQRTGLNLDLDRWSLWSKGVPPWNPWALLRESLVAPSFWAEGHLEGLFPEAIAFRISAHLDLLKRRVEVDEVILEGEAFSIRGEGSADLGGPRFLRGRVELTRLDLSNLPAKWRPLPDLRGLLEGKIDLAGTLDAPRPVGTLDLRRGECKIDKIPRISKIEGTLSLEGTKLRLVSLRGEMGGGRLRASGLLPLPGTQAKAVPKGARELLRLRGDQVLLHLSPRLRLRADLDLRVIPKAEGRFEVQGDVDLVSSKYAHRHSLLPNLKVSGSPRAGQEFRLFRIPPPLGDLLDLDLRIGTRDPFLVRTHLVDTRLGITLRLGGTGSMPRLTGDIQSDGGKIRLPGMAFRLKSGLVHFPPSDPGHPRFVVQAEGRRHSIDVRILAEGTFDDPQVRFGSTPSFPTQDLVVLVLTGELPGRIDRLTDRGKLMLLGNYALSEFLGSLSQDDVDAKGSFLDRISIEVGTEIGPTGLESIVGEYQLSKNFSLQVERDIYEDYNMGIVWRIRF